MESAKNNLQIIDLNADYSSMEHAEKHTVASTERAAQFNGIIQAPVAVRKPSLIEKPKSGKKVRKAQIINKLNYINFQDGTILVNFRHLKYDKVITLKAAPQPCMGDLVDCLWSESSNTSQVIQSYEFSNL